jgi:two-component system, cell cycle sensor histidine kinase DivJ
MNVENWLAGLVHPRIVGDGGTRSLHLRFLASRLLCGLLALALVPPFLVLQGIPSLPEILLLGCLVLPLGAALFLSQTGSLVGAHAISALAVAGIITLLALASGGPASPMLLWFIAIPLEALLTGSARTARLPILLSVLSALGVFALHKSGFQQSLFPETRFLDDALVLPVFTLLLLSHLVSLAIARERADLVQRARLQARDAKDISLLQAVDDLVTWHDHHGHVYEASCASRRMLGLSPQQLEGRGLLHLVHVQDRPIFLKALQDAALSDRPIEAHFRLHTGYYKEISSSLQEEQNQRQEFLWVEMRANRIAQGSTSAGLEEYGESCAVVAVTRDITKRHHHEQELEEARDKAERADALKGRFLATVSHELRTPLNAIIGFSELLKSDNPLLRDEPRQRDYARIIHASGEHLLQMVNTLLDLSRIESGHFNLVTEAFAPVVLLKDCHDLMAIKAQEKAVTLRLDHGIHLPDLVADRRACRQIVLNLLSNAIKFTRAGGEVSMSLSFEGEDCILRVTDTGSGIPEQELPRLGAPFYQVRSSYDREHDGVGLGLSVVKGLVALHQGHLLLESRLGHGTCVTIRLPRNGVSPESPFETPVIPLAGAVTVHRRKTEPYQKPESASHNEVPVIETTREEEVRYRA